MELSRPVVVQQHRQYTLTLDFQGQILKNAVSQEWEDRSTRNERDMSR